jgi:hypothetical protein
LVLTRIARIDCHETAPSCSGVDDFANRSPYAALPERVPMWAARHLIADSLLGTMWRLRHLQFPTTSATGTSHGASQSEQAEKV